MRDAVASHCRGGSLDPPAVRPSFFKTGLGRRTNPQISNRDTTIRNVRNQKNKRSHSFLIENAIFTASQSRRRPPPHTRTAPPHLAKKS